jgi:hypothetical protein
VGLRQFDLRFWDGQGGFEVEAAIDVMVVPGPPSHWEIWPHETKAGSLVVTDDETWTVCCGESFGLLLELVDTNGNKCACALLVVPYMAYRRLHMCFSAGGNRYSDTGASMLILRRAYPSWTMVRGYLDHRD